MKTPQVNLYLTLKEQRLSPYEQEGMKRIFTLITCFQHLTLDSKQWNRALEEISLWSGKGEIRLSLFLCYLISYRENPIESTKKPVELKNEFNKATQYSIDM